MKVLLHIGGVKNWGTNCAGSKGTYLNNSKIYFVGLPKQSTGQTVGKVACKKYIAL